MSDVNVRSIRVYQRRSDFQLLRLRCEPTVLVSYAGRKRLIENIIESYRDPTDHSEGTIIVQRSIVERRSIYHLLPFGVKDSAGRVSRNFDNGVMIHYNAAGEHEKAVSVGVAKPNIAATGFTRTSRNR